MQLLGIAPVSAETSKISDVDSLLAAMKVSYDDYISQYKNKPAPDIQFEKKATDYSKISDDMKVEVLTDLGGKQGSFLKMGEEGTISWEIDVPQEGLYNVVFNYFPIAGKGSSIQREFMIDNEYKFDSNRTIEFQRIWANETNDFQSVRDAYGNDIRVRQVETPRWNQYILNDKTGYDTFYYKVYLSQGKHTISLNSIKEPLALDTIQFLNLKDVPTYEQVMSQYKAAGYTDITNPDDKIVIQGEAATSKSDSTLYPLNDRSSPATVPYSVANLRNNVEGGANWKYPTQWLEWEFDVKEDGLYKLDMRFKQDLVEGTYSSRKIYIDGKVPYKELESVEMQFSRGWQVLQFGGNEPYRIYLTKGKHTIRMENTLGRIADVISIADECITSLNTIYRNILMYTGPTFDAQRDYKVAQTLPNEVEGLATNGAKLYDAITKLDAITGSKGSGSATFERLAFQVTQFAKDPNSIPIRMAAFKDNISALALWVYLSSEQSLTLDYMQFESPQAKLPKADSPWYRKIWHELQSFAASFTQEYNSIDTGTGEKKRQVTIWFGGGAGGRDQAGVLKTLVDSYFTPVEQYKDIKVNLRLVDMSVLLRAVAAGKGPDIVLFEPQEQPLNYALRNAIMDLTQFEDLDTVLQRFSPEAVEPFRYAGHVYALPEQQVFPVMFYRKDILNTLKLDVPQTWDDVHNILTILKKNYLDLGVPSVTAGDGDMSIYAMLLYQNGGAFYNADKNTTLLDDKVSIDSFISWAELYTKYKIPMEMDMTTRFRTGEAPIVITSFQFYNSLNIAAPEIRGLWDFTLVPGTMKPDGTIDRSVASGATATGIMRNTKDPQAAWEVLKWWTSADIQTAYGQEIENIQGASGRWASANIDAFNKLPWTSKDAKTINDQRKWAKAIPEVPGGYYTKRNVINAIRAVLNDGAYPRETMRDWTQQTNDEIARKVAEFGLNK